jgi:Tfp pilus assembly protein PilW
MNNHTYRSLERGITLIEMMIAMLVSLVLIAGVGTVYVSSKRNYAARDQLSTMNDNARVALETLRHHLEHAGYATPAHLPIGRYFYVPGDPDPQAGQCRTLGATAITAMKNMATSNGGANASDTISVRFIGDATLNVDALNMALPAGCLGGQPSITDSLVYNGFRIAVSGGYPSLMAAGLNTNMANQPIVNGIENMQFLYGIDVNDDGTADRFANAASVGANWEKVVSIKVALLARSLAPVADTASQPTFNLLDTTYKPAAPDRFQRAVYTEVIRLRNVAAD